jgi:N-acetylglucosamine malate deacetylase 1
VMCRGDKGAGSETTGKDLGRVRQEETAAAAEVLGATLFWFGAGDGELFDTFENRRKIVEIYRQFRPTLIIAHAVEDYHPDHRAASALAEAASWFCGSRGHATESPVLDCPPKLCFADTVDMTGFQANFYVDVSPHMELKRRMLACHQSQLQRGRDGDFTPLTALMQRQCETRGAQAEVAAAEVFRWHHAFKRMGAF